MDLISRQAAIKLIHSLYPSSPIMRKNRERWKERYGQYIEVEKALEQLPSAQPEEQHGRVFKGIVVEYQSYNTYPECIGKPYFSIKYTKNGQEFIGYGTYKPEVLSEYLKEYFMPSAQPEQKWIPVSKELPKTNVLVWVTDLHQHVSACQLYTDISDWYSESDEWMYKHNSIIAWKPYIVPEPYKEGEPDEQTG